MKYFSTEFRVSWVETDGVNVVHFSNYLRYFERAEEELYNHIGYSYTEFFKKGIWLPRVEAYCKYLSPCRYNDKIKVYLKVDEIGEKHIKYSFEIHNLNTNKKACEGHLVVVTASMNENKSVPIPEEFKIKLKEFFDI